MDHPHDLPPEFFAEEREDNHLDDCPVLIDAEAECTCIDEAADVAAEMKADYEKENY